MVGNESRARIRHFENELAQSNQFAHQEMIHNNETEQTALALSERNQLTNVELQNAARTEHLRCTNCRFARSVKQTRI